MLLRRAVFYLLAWYHREARRNPESEEINMNIDWKHVISVFVMEFKYENILSGRYFKKLCFYKFRLFYRPTRVHCWWWETVVIVFVATVDPREIRDDEASKKAAEFVRICITVASRVSLYHQITQHVSHSFDDPTSQVSMKIGTTTKLSRKCNSFFKFICLH